MKFEKKVSINADWVKKGEEINENDVIQLLDEGRTEQGNYGPQNIFKIKCADGKTEKDFSLNQTSVNNMIDAFGGDSKKWIGKDVKVWAILSNVKGKMIKVYYLSHPDAELDEQGNFVLDGKDNDIPTIDEETGEELGTGTEDMPGEDDIQG